MSETGIDRTDLEECWCCGGLHDSFRKLCPDCHDAGCQHFGGGCQSDHKPVMPDGGTAESGVSREDIQAEKVSELGVDDLIRLFSIRLATFHKRHNLSRERCIGEVALEFRDDYQVNILRILDERDYIHPDGYTWNIQPFDEDTIRKYDPVLPESIEEGGTADVRPGDILKIGEDGALIVGVDEKQAVVMNKSGKLDTHSLATIREAFNTSEIDASLIRDGEIIRGVDAGNDHCVDTDTNQPGGEH